MRNLGDNYEFIQSWQIILRVDFHGENFKCQVVDIILKCFSVEQIRLIKCEVSIKLGINHNLKFFKLSY